MTGEPEEARARLRAELIPYFSLPFYRAMIERSGFAADVDGFDRGMQEGGPDAAAAAISDDFLGLLAAIGSPEEAAASVRRYRDGGATSPCVGGVARTDFDATLEALAGSLELVASAARQRLARRHVLPPSPPQLERRLSRRLPGPAAARADRHRGAPARAPRCRGSRSRACARRPPAERSSRGAVGAPGRARGRHS